MKKNVFSLLLSISAIFVFGQTNHLKLTFTGVDNNSYIQLDSIRVMNRTQNCDTVLQWPDTTLNLSTVGIPEVEKPKKKLHVFQNHPNPVLNETEISVYVPENDNVCILIADLNGKIHVKQSFKMEKGTHKFLFNTGSSQMYVFLATGYYGKSSIKILNSGTSKNAKPSLIYSGIINAQSYIKSIDVGQDFNYVAGDELLVCGHYDNLESGTLDYPQTNKDYVFQFAYNIPCPGIPTVDYGGHIYNTVQIGNQCWLKENLNIGEMITSGSAKDNGIIEKFCADNETENCDFYGGLYQWGEIMQYTMQPGARGICPEGWHIPTNEEWKILLGTADSQYPIGDAQWDYESVVGFDAGKNLKSTTGWFNNGNGMDLLGFSGLPGGMFGSFLTEEGYFWSSIEYSIASAWYLSLSYYMDTPMRIYNWKSNGYSVRCIRDNNGNTPNAAFSATPYSGPAPITISFMDESANNPTSWHWDFGDGNTSTEQNPENTYEEAGSYTVQLTVSTDFGSDTETATNFITVTSGGNISPCPGIETIEYGGQVYNTALIGTQCWLKENLNIGEMIAGEDDMEDNGIVEKYCYFDMPERCNEYGGLYQWDEVMQYSTQEGAQGICPEGWHIPTDDEWKILEGTVDSQYPIGHQEWNEVAWRGYDVGYRLKKQNDWPVNGNNLFGFSALPGGKIDTSNTFTYLGTDAYFWSSTEATTESAWKRMLYEYPMANRHSDYKSLGLSVRCIMDSSPNSPNAAFSASPTYGDVPLTVNFSDESTNVPTSWHWDFGDGYTSTIAEPEYTYPESGEYSVTLTSMHEADGCIDSTYKEEYIYCSGVGIHETDSGYFRYWVNINLNTLIIEADENLLNSDCIIYNISGQPLKSFKLNQNKTHVPLNDYPSGAYLISVHGRVAGKFLVTKQ